MADRPMRRQLVKMLGSLPLVADFMRRLGIRRAVDRLCPSRSNARLTHGQVALAVLANRLTQPQAMYRFLEWARRWAVGETFGFEASALNDDRLARCLDALAPHLDAIQGSVLARAVTAFGLDLRQLHWDLTSVVLEGAFDPAAEPKAAPEGEPAYPQPAYGYGGVSDQKQIRVGELVTSDGLVPIFHRSFSGNQADVGTVVALMKTVGKYASLPDCLVIGDSKLLSAAVLQGLRAQKLHFLAPLPDAAELDREFLTLPPEGWQELDYVSQEQARRPPEERHRYWGQEVAWIWRNPETGQEETFRRLYVRSSEERDTCQRTRKRRLIQATAELNALLEKQVEAAAKAAAKALEKQPRRPKAGADNAATEAQRRAKRRAQLLAQAGRILVHRKVQAFLTVSVRTVKGAPELAWELDEAALAAAERLDGYYVLLTSWPQQHATPHDLLLRWKRQSLAERRFHDWKGPLRVRPVFVTTPERIAALMLLLHLALLVFSLIEREARRALAAKQQAKVANLLAGHVAAVPTGANILIAFEHLFLIVEEDPPQGCYATPMLPVQQALWELLGARMPTFG